MREHPFDNATLSCSSLSEAIPAVLDFVTRYGRVALVRGEENLEVLGVDIAIVDPTDRIPDVPGRRSPAAFCIAEFLWYSAQRIDLSSLQPYAPSILGYYGGMREVTGSDYGRQLFGAKPGGSQWNKVLALLGADQGSKRAFMSVFAADQIQSLLPANGDVSCTVGFQVLVRDDHLHWVTVMRANDAYRGFVSDTFTFTLWQELLASTLGIRVGSYLHRPMSLHTFPEDQESIRRVLLAVQDFPDRATALRMPSLRHDSFWRHLSHFWQMHDECRLREDWRGLAAILAFDDEWWSWVAATLLRHHKIDIA